MSSSSFTFQPLFSIKIDSIEELSNLGIFLFSFGSFSCKFVKRERIGKTIGRPGKADKFIGTAVINWGKEIFKIYRRNWPKVANKQISRLFYGSRQNGFEMMRPNGMGFEIK